MVQGQQRSREIQVEKASLRMQKAVSDAGKWKGLLTVAQKEKKALQDELQVSFFLLQNHFLCLSLSALLTPCLTLGIDWLTTRFVVAFVTR